MARPTCYVTAADGIGMVKLEVHRREERFAEDTDERRYLRLDVNWPSEEACALLQSWMEERRQVEVQGPDSSWAASEVRIVRIGTPAAGGLSIGIIPRKEGS